MEDLPRSIVSDYPPAQPSGGLGPIRICSGVRDYAPPFGALDSLRINDSSGSKDKSSRSSGGSRPAASPKGEGSQSKSGSRSSILSKGKDSQSSGGSHPAASPKGEGSQSKSGSRPSILSKGKDSQSSGGSRPATSPKGEGSQSNSGSRPSISSKGKGSQSSSGSSGLPPLTPSSSSDSSSRKRSSSSRGSSDHAEAPLRAGGRAAIPLGVTRRETRRTNQGTELLRLDDSNRVTTQAQIYRADHGLALIPQAQVVADVARAVGAAPPPAIPQNPTTRGRGGRGRRGG